MKKRKMLIALICMATLLTAVGASALSNSPIASVGGETYTTLQEAVDAAARGETEADRVITLLKDVDLKDGTVAVTACDITLNLNGFAISGTAEVLIILKDGARLVVEDAESGQGTIMSAFSGAGCAIRIEDARSTLVVNSGTIDRIETSAEGGVAVRGAAGSVVIVNGGSVGGIADADGEALARNDGEEQLVQYDLTIEPPLAGALAFGFTTRPGLSHPYGAAATNEDGTIHAWLPEGQTWISVRIGCAVYSGTIRGGSPYAATLTKTGEQHDFSGAWRTNAAQHWKDCQNGCGAQVNRGAHTGGEATCTEPAVCSTCGAHYGEALGHAFDQVFTTDAEPTCTTAGSKSRHCMRCDAVTEVTPLSTTDEHTFSAAWTNDGTGHWHAATCGHNEQTSGFTAHTPAADDGDCTTAVLCSVCGYTLVAAESGHNWDDMMSSAAEHWHVCGNDGCTQTADHEAHTGGEATCTEQAICSICGASYGEAPEHDFEDDFTVDAAAVCLTAGSKSRHCARCGEKTDVTAIPAPGHSYSTGWTIDTYFHYHSTSCEHTGSMGYELHGGGAATCTERAVCSTCGASYGAPLEHSFSTVWMDDGTNHWHVCTRIGCTEVSGLGAHAGGTATCTQKAVCSACGASYGETLGHAFETEWTVDAAATCTTAGSKSHHCARCGEKADVTVILAEGHDWDDWITITPATCMAAGLDWRVCLTDPMHIEERTLPIDSSAHDWDAGVVTTPETCIAAGVRTFTCARSAVHTRTESIPSSAHTHTVTIDQNPNYTITATADGAPVESGAAIPCQTGLTVTATPIDGYKLTGVHVNGVTIPNGSTWTLIGRDVSIGASVEIHTYTITVVAPSKGTITPGGSRIVNHGDDLTFTITPHEDYGIRGVLVDGVDVGAATSYTLFNITASHTVSADVARVYHITATAGSYGRISPSGTTAVFAGADQTYTITPDPSCELLDVRVDGPSVGQVTSYTFYDVTQAHTIHATFKANLHTITASATGGGSITPAGPTQLGYGESLTVQMAPDPGFMIYDVSVDGVSVGRPASYTFDDNHSHTINAVFRPVHTITTRLDTTGGSLVPGGPYTAGEGENVKFIAAPDPNYVVDYIEIDGTKYDGLPSHTFTNVTTDHTIAVAFNPMITAIAGTGGTISPEGAVAVSPGSDQAFTIMPNPGYVVKDVKVDTVSQGAITSYTFANVTMPHTILASFERIMYQIQASADTGGKISPAGASMVAWGTSLKYTITPNAGYIIQGVKVDGTSVGAVTAYIFSNVTSAHTIEASFIPTYRIGATHGPGGTISPAGNVDVPQGGSRTYFITPSTGYEIAELKVDGAAVAPAGSYTFTNVTAAHTISVTFRMRNYTISFAVMTNGSVSSTPAGTARLGDVVNLTVTPASNYRLKAGSLKVNGTAITGMSFTMPAQNVTISAEFEERTYAVSIVVTGGGTVVASHTQAPFGTAVSVAATPNFQYRLVEGSLKGNDIPIDGATFLMPAADVVITAQFEEIVYTVTPPQCDHTLHSSGSQEFNCSGPYAEFVGLSFNGVAVDSSWYSVSSADGSTFIRVKKEFMNEQAAGVHYFTFRYLHANASARMSIYPKPDDGFNR